MQELRAIIIMIVVGEFGEDQLVHQVVETILTATATKATTEEPPSHEPNSVATSNSSK